MRPVPKCPLRPGESCTLCIPGASGPEDCPTVYAVMTDSEFVQILRNNVIVGTFAVRSSPRPALEGSCNVVARGHTVSGG